MLIYPCIRPCITTNIMSIFTEISSRRAYFFSSENNDSLELLELFSGRFTAFIVGTSTDGINPILLDGIQGDWVNTDYVDVLHRPNFNHIEVHVEDLKYIVDETFTGILIYALDGIWNEFNLGYDNHPEIVNELRTSWEYGVPYPDFFIKYVWKIGDCTLTIGDDILISRGI